MQSLKILIDRKKEVQNKSISSVNFSKIRQRTKMRLKIKIFTKLMQTLKQIKNCNKEGRPKHDQNRNLMSIGLGWSEQEKRWMCFSQVDSEQVSSFNGDKWSIDKKKRSHYVRFSIKNNIQTTTIRKTMAKITTK